MSRRPRRLEDLGFRRASPRELHDVWMRWRRGKLPLDRAPTDPFPVPLAIVHREPLVVYGGIVPDAPLGPAGLLGRAMRKAPAWFLLSPTWTLEDVAIARRTRRYAILHRWRNRHHRLVFVCSTEEEAALLRARGEATFVHNKTTHVREDVFRPLPGARVEFDAIYNAQLVPWKRHELAVAIPRCAFLFYRSRHAYGSTAASERALVARHLAAAPEHVFLNPYDAAGWPVRFPPEEVNRHLNRAAVGLCLSETEGSMFSCVEYLLAGLPVVTTPNRGGRDFFADGVCCVTAAPEPQAIADAVAAQRERGLAPEEIRERTLERVRRERERFVSLLRDVYARAGVHDGALGAGASGRPFTMTWTLSDDARDQLIAAS